MLSSFPATDLLTPERWGAPTTKHKCFRWSFIWASGGSAPPGLSFQNAAKAWTQLHSYMHEGCGIWIDDWIIYRFVSGTLRFWPPFFPLEFQRFVSGACHSSITSKGDKGSFILFFQGFWIQSPSGFPREDWLHSPIASKNIKSAQMGNKFVDGNFYFATFFIQRYHRFQYPEQTVQPPVLFDLLFLDAPQGATNNASQQTMRFLASGIHV